LVPVRTRLRHKVPPHCKSFSRHLLSSLRWDGGGQQLILLR
jgi:hypothetical protein